MEQKNHGSPSFINIAVLLLFAIVIAVASSVTTYFFLSSRSNEQYSATQPPVISQSQTNILPTILPTIQTTVPTDETANWKVYRNEQYGFEVKYPKTLKATIVTARNNMSLTSMAQLLGGEIFHIDYKDNEFRSQTSSIAVYIYDSNNLSLDEWLKANSTVKPFATEPTLEFHDFKKVSDSVIVGDLSAIEFQNTVMSSISHNVALKKDQYIYVIDNTNVGDDLSSIYKKILSTFKFLQ